MKRIQSFEFHDLAWFPQGWRDFITDIMNVFDSTFNPYAPVIPLLAQAVKKSGAPGIIDLCSGAGHTALRIQEYLERTGGQAANIILTDKFPNLQAFKTISLASKGRIKFKEEPVDAMQVPDNLMGFRTMFTSFHHFAPPDALEILKDAVQKRDGIGIFEYTERTWVWLIALLVTPAVCFVSAFMIRPFNWRRVLQAIIGLPFMMFLWDAVISCLRSYTLGDLEQMALDAGAENYHWETGRVHSFGGCYITYLLGYPTSLEPDLR